jgi:phage shock protein PspC (stress-responsive transcriptional regulator)
VDQPTWEQPPPQPGPPDRRQLRRSGTDKMIGGVAGGLAEYSGIDSVLWRVGFVALTLAGGSGILVYLLLWVLMSPPPLGPDYRPGALDGLVDRLHTAVASTRAVPPRD